MNQLKKFVFENQQVRVIYINNEPWFVTKDICDVLEIGNPSQALNRLEDDEKHTIILNEGIGNPYKSVVNEPGLYTLILGSRKYEAKNFKRWITHEVIPSIRKHGAYMTPDTIEKVLNDPDTIIQLATTLKEERAKRMEAEALAERQKPKVLFANAVEASDTSILIGQLAKLITQNGVPIGQNRLFSWLRKERYLGRKGAHYNDPTQYAIERGWFEVVERTINNPDGSVRITRTTKVTGKGQVYFINKFLELN